MNFTDTDSCLNPEQRCPLEKSQHLPIVMVDDDADDYYLLTRVLKESYPAHRVIPIYDSLEVIAKLDALPELPAFLLLDLNMPLKNGFEVLKEVRSLGRYTSLPIFVYTSSSNPTDMTRCKTLGANDFIEKPTSYNDFHQIIEQLWRSWLTSSAATPEQ